MGRWLGVAAVSAALVLPASAARATTDGTGLPEAAIAPAPLTAPVRPPRAVDLHVPGDSSQAQHVSDSGVVVGVVSTDDEPRVFRWEDGVASVLDLAATSIEARDVNVQGQVLVNVYDRGSARVVLWQPDGTVTPVSQDGVWSAGSDLNDKGVVAGIIGTPEGEQRAVVWQDGQTQDLGDLGVGYVYASALNNRGQVVGTASQPDGPDVGFLWQDGVLTPLPLPDGLTGSVAWNLNERGDVLGEAHGEASPPGGRAIVWDRGATPRYLGDSGLRPNALNSRGIVVGAADSDPPGALVPALVDRRGVHRLPTPHGGAGEARALNDLNTVVGYENGPTGWQALAWVFGIPVPLAAPPGGGDATASWAVDVNRRGLVAGSVTLPAGPDAVADRAVVWDLAPTSRRIEQSLG